MSIMHRALQEAIALLEHPRSPKRRSGAKRLRKLRDSAAGPALLSALQKEVQDTRTWETQYHIIMALGECDYKEALPFLYRLASTTFDASMIYVALGDALVRLARSEQQ